MVTRDEFLDIHETWARGRTVTDRFSPGAELGDMAEVLHRGEALPPLAGVALREGRAVARNIAARTQGCPPKPFRYFDRGTIGRNEAIVEIRGLHLRGFIGWVTWLAVTWSCSSPSAAGFW